MTPFSISSRHHADNEDRHRGLLQRARSLRSQSDELIDFESSLKNSAHNLNQREADLAERENKLARKMAGLEKRERALEQREHAQAERESRAIPDLSYEERAAAIAALAGDGDRTTFSISRGRTAPGEEDFSVADAKALSVRILDAGRKRRNEIPAPPVPSGDAGKILRAGMIARGEIEDDKPPRTAAERLAAQIIAAGRKRRGEIE